MKRENGSISFIDGINASIKENQEKFFLEDLELLYAISQEEDFGKDKVVDNGKIFNALEWIFFHVDENKWLTRFQFKLLKDILKNDLKKQITPQNDPRPPHQRIDKGREYLEDSIYNVLLSEKELTEESRKKLCKYMQELLNLRKKQLFVIINKR